MGEGYEKMKRTYAIDARPGQQDGDWRHSALGALVSKEARKNMAAREMHTRKKNGLGRSGLLSSR
jgi:hypothetical protein